MILFLVFFCIDIGLIVFNMQLYEEKAISTSNNEIISMVAHTADLVPNSHQNDVQNTLPKQG